ncbi:MAG: radical SAM protein [Candidatus Omnitrophota bacterium]
MDAQLTLIQPPKVRIKYNISGIYAMPPLGIAYIAAYVRDRGIKVNILDMPAFKMSDQDLANNVKSSSCFIYGITCNITNLSVASRLASIIKQNNPKATVIIGGPGVTFGSDILFKKIKGIDIIVNGEGEETTYEICKAVIDGAGLSSIRGISYKAEGKVIVMPPRPYLNLDNLPLPARDILPNHLYKMHPPFGIYPPMTLIETSRGCNYSCSFCTFKRPFSFRSASRVVDEVREVKNKYGVKEVHFVDPNFTYNRSNAEKICALLIENKLNIHWTCKTRVDLVDKQLLQLMRNAGCYMISYGIESGSQAILNKVDKKISLVNTVNALRWTRQAKIRSSGYVLIGSPGETDDSINETVKLLKKLRPDFALFGRLLPDPNALLTKEELRKGRIDLDTMYNFYNNIEKSHANFFGIDEDKINLWYNKSIRNFYFNLPYIFSKLIDFRSPQDLINIFRGLRFLLTDRFISSSLTSK